ncbi:endo alpha-1,4 polygalactosaminidase [Mycolicibacterium sediminis]|uniref:Glycoside-hydrolase family GH114 TIM-barrel domain-containing protein n=1 Tax=Mycolicibacterium sediminis TaxID=1286180 RepID=A0A7I7QYA4_9MYCO|nr:hypothetical protein MSEDJ_53880 [Mycolicibacterium sediminis]
MVVVTVLLAGCSSAPTPTTGVVLPPVSGPFDYQLGGAYDLPGMAVVARDATADPPAGAYGICYVNGFQTQPGQGADWLEHRSAAVLRDVAGNAVSDPDWPDEYVLDPSTPDGREQILDAVGPVITDCARKGFDAVEIDNLDTFTRFTDRRTGLVDRAGALDLATAYVELAHDHGLAIGQKNAAESTELLRGLGFDFAVAEECAAFDECDSYKAGYGSHVLQIEYSDNMPRPFPTVCAAPDRAPLAILRDRELLPAGAEGHVYEQCPSTG